MNDYVYKPLQASPLALLMYLAAVTIIGALEVFSGGTLLPILPIQSNWHLFFWLAIGLFPLMGLQMGWSYVLTDDALVVMRFGSEKYRVPLGEYADRSISLAMPRLRFASRSVYVVSSADTNRQAFLAELDARVAKVGGVVPMRFAELVGVDGIRIRVSHLALPPRCSVCGAEAHAKVAVTARRGFDVVIARVEQLLPIDVPVCDAHARRFRLARFGAWLTVFAIPTLVTVGIFLANGMPLGGVLPAFAVGAIVGLLAMRIAAALGFRRLVDWHALGVAAIGLEPDLTVVTMRIASDDLRRHLASSAARAAASTFA